MSNEAFVTVQPDTDYQNLATLASITLTEGDTYTLQLVRGDIMIQEAGSKPSSGGFHINFNIPFQFTAGTDALWVKNLREFEEAVINIAK